MPGGGICKQCFDDIEANRQAATPPKITPAVKRPARSRSKNDLSNYTNMQLIMELLERADAMALHMEVALDPVRSNKFCLVKGHPRDVMIGLEALQHRISAAVMGETGYIGAPDGQ